MRSFVVWVLAVAALDATAVAQDNAPAPPVLTQVYACREITDDAQRLACFDGAVGAMATAQTQGEFAAVDRQQAAELRAESFGFQLPSLADILGAGSDADAVVELVVDRVSARGNGYYAFEMANGQVWVQIVPESASNVRPGAAVTVRRGMMGSFMLSAGRGRAHRVRRES